METISRAGAKAEEARCATRASRRGDGRSSAARLSVVEFDPCASASLQADVRNGHARLISNAPRWRRRRARVVGVLRAGLRTDEVQLISGNGILVRSHGRRSGRCSSGLLGVPVATAARLFLDTRGRRFGETRGLRRAGPTRPGAPQGPPVRCD